MNVIPHVLFGLSALCLAHASLAATTGSWTANNLAPNVYGAGIENSNFYITPQSVPKGALISSLSWNVGAYANGATSQNFKICYAGRYETSYGECRDISASRVGTTDYFKGKDAKGKFKITGVLTGGSYPVYPSHRNTIKVDYHY
ncbi:hypothetical protein F3J44_08985 [Pantoea sp. Tr-811]|uniref:hypothetical protein n=1 Tax=unclassified Pantoea TaxID=2630326 RepID=UPI00141F9938|nr:MULTISPECIES: hypothetical protein [unclassified Pantoea]NIE76530.1 hypothetical protein [Pantoea sp. Ap-967]NIF26523.1 hypothetical protein [Pantoea sp. Tr-811]